MSEDKKTIQEALAEVQRNAELKRIEEAKKAWGDSLQVDEASMPNIKVGGKKVQTSTKPTTAPAANQNTPSSTPAPTPTSGINTAANIATGASMLPKKMLGGAAVGAAAGELGKEIAFGSEFARDLGHKIYKNVPGAAAVSDYMLKKREDLGIPSTAPKEYQRTSADLPKIDVPAAPKAETPKPEAPKAETPSSFGAAFKAAREKATAAGKPSTGQFDYQGKQYQTNVAGEKYVPMSQQTKVSSEDGKKKKMSEDTNPLIAAFLDLQSKNSSNMFEAAKKAKKDYDKDGKVESPKNEVWGSRFRAAKAAGKMEEGMIDPKDPSVQGSSDVTSTPAKKTSMPKPTAPKTDSSVQGSGDVTMNGKPARVKEEAEVTFSQAEIDHINSFFLEASVAPNRPEVATGADSTSDKMSQNDVTATAESGKKLRKEEAEELDELHGKGKLDTILRGIESKQNELQRKASRANYLMAASRAKDSHKGPDSEKKFYMSKSKELRKEEVELDEHKSMDGEPLKAGDSVGFKDGHEQYGKIHSISPQGHAKVKVWDSEAGEHYHVTKHVSRLWKETNEEVELDEISKNLAKSYTDKSKTNISDLNKATPYLNKMYLNAKTSKDKKHYEKTFNKNMETIDRRKKGIEMAGKVLSKEEIELEEGRPRKNPTPETTERDPRQHIQVAAGRAAAGNVIDFHHNNGTKSKITPAMGRKITSHLNGLKPADRQAAVNKMHDSAEGLKV